jgi:hypothetical protein
MEILPALLTSKTFSKALLERIAVESVLSPSLFWDAIEGMPMTNEPTASELVEELRDYLRRGEAASESDSVMTLHEVRWHLTRSSGWGNNIELLNSRIVNELAPEDSIREALGRFIREGFLEGQNRWRHASALAHFPDNQRHDLERHWDEMENSVRAMQAASSGEINRGILASSVEYIEKGRKHFLDVLDEIALQPGLAMRSIQGLVESLDQAHVPFEYQLAPDCPSIAIHNEEFQEAILLILNNASKQLQSLADADILNRITHFSFEPSRNNKMAVNIVVRQGWNWKVTEGLEGGLERLRELVGRYGGILLVNNHAVAGQSCLTIRLLCWPFPSTQDAVGELGNG